MTLCSPSLKMDPDFFPFIVTFGGIPELSAAFGRAHSTFAVSSSFAAVASIILGQDKNFGAAMSAKQEFCTSVRNRLLDLGLFC